MNPFEVKVYMLEKGLKIALMARELCKGTEVKESSMQTMIADLIYGRRFYPILAKKLNDKYGIQVERSPQFESVSEVVRKAA